MKGLGYLDVCDLNQDMYNILLKDHKSAISLLTGRNTEYGYKKTVHESLWRVDIEVLKDLIVFFALQEMYEYASIIQKAIEIKTLQAYSVSLK